MNEFVLEVKNLCLKYGKKEILKDITFSIKKGEIVGLLGQSGSGKSTIANAITLLCLPCGGEIWVNGEMIYPKMQCKNLYKNVQIIYQDAQNSFNPKFSIGFFLKEIVRNLLGVKNTAAIFEMLKKVKLNKGIFKAYPKELSGGECQRCAIARALLAKPKLLICDEATSNLDVGVQASIIDLISDLKGQISMLFISHDLALMQGICDKILFIEDGKITKML